MKILLVCSLGMSSAIAAKALQQEATKQGLNVEVHECSTQAFEEEVKNDYKVALVAPQIRHRYETLKGESEKAGVPCLLISPQGYSPLGGPKLMAQLKSELGENIFE